MIIISRNVSSYLRDSYNAYISSFSCRCPVDLYVFPELQKTPDGALQADFYAFKIPDSNLLVFQATVRTCRGPCEPVILFHYIVAYLSKNFRTRLLLLLD